MKTDFLVIGSGLAGLNYVLNIARNNPKRKIVVVTKANDVDSNTKYAQGGIAIVQNKTDSYQKHIQDTLLAGDGICEKDIVKMVIKDSSICLNELTSIGVEFDKNKEGNFDLGREGGHSENRVLHHQDITGYEIERKLIDAVRKYSNITLLDHHFAVDLILNNNHVCSGVKVLNERTNELVAIQSLITFMATGGIGQVYRYTTNPLIATGDGIAMAKRLGAEMKDLEFIQFHPTALYEESGAIPSFLISEAVRGFGAKLRLENGDLFMRKYAKKGELASRDIVSRAMDNEIRNSNLPYVFLDCTGLDASFERHFPNIVRKCRSIGIDPLSDMIPVVPAQHYLCGGIKTDQNGQTSIKNLLAGGECARTGLHGANRLASNSLLEAFIFSRRSANLASTIVEKTSFEDCKTLINWGKGAHLKLDIVSEFRKKIQELMSEKVGIIRSNRGLLIAKRELEQIESEIENLYRSAQISIPLCELRNIVTVARIVVEQSLSRHENRGGFYNVDYVTK